jgi:hypothetical protein
MAISGRAPRSDLVEQILDEIKQKARIWEPVYTSRVGGADAWIAKCETIASDPDGVRRTVESEVIKFKLGAIEDIGLVCAE